MDIDSIRTEDQGSASQTPHWADVAESTEAPATDEPLSQEEAWIRAAQQGDPDAFAALVDAHGGALLAYLKRLTGSTADAEDLYQETLLRAYSALNGFHPRGRFRAWLFTIAYHKWVYAHRRKNRVRLAESEDLERWSRQAPRDDTTVSDEMAGRIRETVALLPEDQREVVWLRLAEGMSHKEIAEVVKVRPATVRWRFFRARQAMRKALSPWVMASRRKAI